MNARVHLLIPIALIAQIACAQVTGKVRITGIPEQGLRYVLDGKYEMTDREVTLTEGDHHFTFWAPEHRILDTTIFVMGNWTYDLKVVLQRPYEFVEYRSELERYHSRQKLGRTIPPIVTAGLGAWAVVSTLRYAKAHKDLDALGDEYSTLSDPAAIARLKEEEIPAAKDEFNKMRTQTYVSAGLFAVSLGAAAYIRHRIAHQQPPTYEDKERSRFEGLVWLPGPSGGTWAAAITIPIR